MNYSTKNAYKSPSPFYSRKGNVVFIPDGFNLQPTEQSGMVDDEDSSASLSIPPPPFDKKNNGHNHPASLYFSSTEAEKGF